MSNVTNSCTFRCADFYIDKDFPFCFFVIRFLWTVYLAGTSKTLCIKKQSKKVGSKSKYFILIKATAVGLENVDQNDFVTNFMMQFQPLH